MIYAKGSKGDEVHILHADIDRNYYCIKCSDIVKPKRGLNMPWHFAHTTNRNCIGKKQKSLIGYVLKLTSFNDCKAKMECNEDCKYNAEYKNSIDKLSKLFKKKQLLLIVLEESDDRAITLIFQSKKQTEKGSNLGYTRQNDI